MHMMPAYVAVAGLCLPIARPLRAEEQPRVVSKVAAVVRGGVGTEAGTVRVRGIVTLAYSDNSAFAIQDDSWGIWATTFRLPEDAPERATRKGLRAGDVVEVSGTLDRGGYAPLILVDELLVVGHEPLPEPLAADLPRLFRGGDNCRRVAMEGVVRASRSDGRYDGLILDVDARRIRARFSPDMPRDKAADLIDATVRLIGVTAAVRNARGEFLCPSLSIGSATDIEVVEAAPGPPFAAPLIPLERIAQFSGAPLPRHRIRTRGTVSAALPGKIVFLQATAGGLRVQVSAIYDSSPGDGIRPGDVVEVAGFLDMSRQIAGLAEAVVRRTGREQPPAPQSVTPDEITAINVTSRRTGEIATPGDFDGCLVTFPARVVEVKPSDSAGQIALSSGNSTLTALLDNASFKDISTIQPGSDVQVTGVIQMQLQGEEGLRSVSSDPVVQQMSLLLRSADDVIVLRAPSWWTAARLAALLGAVAAVLAAALVGLAVLRREVRSTTLRLADEMQSRRNAAIEFQATLRERNRLAANLHDTLLQTLRGIDFQLGACQTQGDKPTGDPWEYLDVARKMVNHAAEELRGSVWALRTMPVAGKSFGESLEAIARQTGHGHAEHIAVRTSGAAFEVPQFVAGNLLLVAQEAIYNALAHADAGQIDVDAAFDAATGMVEITIVDDGRGFAKGSQSGPDQGHFGLIGMWERIERLGGEFTIASRPGAGTTVRAKVRKHDYDSRIDAGEPVSTHA